VAQKPDGKPARVERVTFTRPAAERIAAVVREVEAGDRDIMPMGVSPRLQSAAFRLRLATFTGNWETGTYKTVTLSGSTQTASVYNWCNPALGGDTASTTQSRYVIFGKVGGTNSAVEIEMQAASQTCHMSLGSLNLTELPGYDAASIQLLGHNTTGPCLEWYSITACSTATAA
jgi:hypothetical protein